MIVSHIFLLSACLLSVFTVTSFSAITLTNVKTFSNQNPSRSTSNRIKMVSDVGSEISGGGGSSAEKSDYLYNPQKRDEYYGDGSARNVAKYLVDLHDAKATFDFCGGMMFQLVLTKQLRNHLAQLSEAQQQQKDKKVELFDASKGRMFQIPGYEKSSFADNIRIFHGREVRKFTDAAGGMGFALQLSMANDSDPEGWTSGEISDYDGWGHDVGRTWRNGERLEKEGFQTYRNQFGKDAFGLHHRCYLHLDGNNRIWLSAEDGCEGTPGPQKAKQWGWLDAFKM